MAAGNLLGGSPAGFVNVRVGAGLKLTAGVLSIDATTAGFGLPGGSFNSIQYNANGSFGGVGPLTNGQLLIGATGLPPVAASLTQPAAGLTIAGGSGSITFALANDLAALEAMASTGLVARTASETYALRTLTGPAAGITVADGNGVSGNPTLSLANDLAALEAMASTGLVARIASETYAQRTITGVLDRITLSDGDGVAGNPQIDIAATYVGQTSIVTLGTVTTGTWNATKIGLAYGGTNADLSATGGTSQVLKQASAGATITVGTLGVADLSGLGAGVATFLATPSSANLATAVTGETGSGALVFGTSPTLDGTITLTGMTAGSVFFAGVAGVLSQDNANLFWDNTNNRLGILTATPGNTLDIGDSATAAISMSVTNLNAGTAAQARIICRNDTTGSNGGQIIVGCLGTGFTTSNGFWQDSGYITAEGNLSGGLALMTRAAASMRFYTNGATNLRMSITSGGLVAFGPGETSAFPALKRSSAILQGRLGDDSAYCAFEANTLRTATAYTVATLPAAGSAGRRAYVTDALAPAFGAAVAGGGAVITPVFDTGAAWNVG